MEKTSMKSWIQVKAFWLNGHNRFGEGFIFCFIYSFSHIINLFPLTGLSKLASVPAGGAVAAPVAAAGGAGGAAPAAGVLNNQFVWLFLNT